tara:strand:- start:1371 stop:1640 length:270 start_codon:yes stop_codon:yes gene_type:complete
MFRKYLATLVFLLLGLASIHFLKNETRELEVKIEKKTKNISDLREDLEIQKVEFGYLSNPQRISELAKTYLSKNYISLFPNQLVLDEKK